MLHDLCVIKYGVFEMFESKRFSIKQIVLKVFKVFRFSKSTEDESTVATTSEISNVEVEVMKTKMQAAILPKTRII